MEHTHEGLRITFLTHYFPPEIGAPQARLLELARRLNTDGDTVTVVTGFPNYPKGVVQEGYRGRFALEERLDGVRVLRRWVFATPNKGFLKRIVNHLSFVLTSLCALRALGPTDVIFVESPPLLIGIAALAFSRVKRAPFVLNVSDVWPQSAIELGALSNPLAIRLAEWLERHLYRRAAFVTVPTRGIRRQLASRGVPERKVVLLTNGVDVDVYKPAAHEGAMARELGLAGRKVFLYAGTHGMAQGLDVILEAARLTRDPSVLYVLVGEGADKAALQARAVQEGIANVVFLPNQPKASMPALLNLAYATVIALKPLDVFRSALPSKMFESMAAGRPIAGSMWGEAAELIEAAGCGVVAQPGDAVALQQAVDSLAADPESARRMGERGRAYVVEHFNRADLAEQLGELLRRAAAKPRERTSDRALDLAIAIPAMVVAAPILLVAGAAIKLDSPGPVFYRGLRVGKDESLFRIHKLRTMQVGSDATGPMVTAGDDGRLTRVGRVLRRTKIDELPQLWNVVTGEMSLVGPRPEDPAFVEQYTPEQRRLLEVRPGITGPATLDFIDEEDMLRGGLAEATYVRSVLPRKLASELDFLEHATFAGRVGILLRTAGAVLRRPFGPARGSRGRSRPQPR